ncbi:MAG: hypothetical protein NVSMB65_17640 [Chloroflexota bacterium]
MSTPLSGDDRPAQRPTVSLTAIGIVHRLGMPGGATTGEGDYFDPFAASRLAVSPEWVPGLLGIEAFSHLVVVLSMERAAPRLPGDPLTHRVEAAPGMPEVGFFSTRTPRRPNPLGLCCPRLLGRDGAVLRVSGLDAWPGTPVLDIKGYYPRDALRADAAVPAWLHALWAMHDAARGPHRL